MQKSCYQFFLQWNQGHISGQDAILVQQDADGSYWIIHTSPVCKFIRSGINCRILVVSGSKRFPTILLS